MHCRRYDTTRRAGILAVVAGFCYKVRTENRFYQVDDITATDDDDDDDDVLVT